MNGTREMIEDIMTRLTATGRRMNFISVVDGLSLTAFVAAVAILLLLILESLLWTPPEVRWVLLLSLLLVVGIILLRTSLVPMLTMARLLRNTSEEATAILVGKRYPEVADHLLNILQLWRERDQEDLYSTDLIDASLVDVWKEIGSLDFSAVVDYGKSKQHARLFLSVVAAGALMFITAPGTFLGAADRLFTPGESFETPTRFRFRIEPGNKEVAKGESVDIRVKVEGEPLRDISLHLKPEGQVEFETRTLFRDSSDTYSNHIPSLKSSLSYYISSGDVRSETYGLTVIDRPVVRSIRLTLDYPAYTRLPSRVLDENIGDVTALKGTRVRVSVTSNKQLVEAMLRFTSPEGSVSSSPLEIRSSGCAGEFVVRSDQTYQVGLKDLQRLTNIDPIEYRIHALSDDYPVAVIEVPGRNIDIAENTSLAMLFRLTDDYGFSSARLAYRLEHSRYETPATNYTTVPIPLPQDTRNEIRLSYPWSLSSLSLVPEDVVSYYLEVLDNDRVSGPKSARSETYTLRLPSLEEVFAEMDRAQEHTLESLQDALEQANTAKRDLEELQQTMKKNQQKMDWQEQRKVEELMAKQEEIRQKLEEASQTVDQMLSAMQQQNVLTRETMDKYEELQRLMSEMDSPALAEVMQRVRDALRQMNPEQMRQALQQFTFSEELLRKGIERTLELLKRIQIEQKVDELTRRAEEMLKRQEEISERTDPQHTSAETENLVARQEGLKEMHSSMERELEKLQHAMQEFPEDMPLEEMDRVMEELSRSDLEELMQQASAQMQRGDMEKARESQQQASSRMQSHRDRMQQLQQALQQKQQRQIVHEMRKSIQDLLEISERQESLKNSSSQLEQNSSRFREMSQDQMEALRDLVRVTNALSQLSQKTFSISPELGKSIGDAMREMNNALTSLEQRNGAQSSQHQSAAMGSLNEAAQQLQNSLSGMMQGGGQGMGMAGMMQRLQQMMGMQQGVNQGTQHLGGMTPQQAAEFGRLAAEQGMIRKSLEELTREAAARGELSKLLGDLRSLAREMREVQTDLAQGNVNPETLKKQDRILSRLLDSQRSLRERDFEQRRRAHTGRTIPPTSPREIDLATQQQTEKLRQDLLKALEEGYTRDYEALIRRYFELLEKESLQR